MYHYKCNESIRMFRIMSLVFGCIFLQPFTGWNAKRETISHAIFCVRAQNSDEWSIASALLSLGGSTIWMLNVCRNVSRFFVAPLFSTNHHAYYWSRNIWKSEGNLQVVSCNRISWTNRETLDVFDVWMISLFGDMKKMRVRPSFLLPNCRPQHIDFGQRAL